MSDQVRQMFASIAGKYDLANTVLSLGIHHLWRKKTVKLSGAKKGDAVLDCATGTGDLAIEFKRTVGDNGSVLGTDFCAEMIAFAPEKAEKNGLVVDFEVADAMNLPYDDNRFDITSISFGIRNVDDPLVSLKELSRVTKSGGKIVVLEFGQPTGIISLPYRIYSKYIMPKLGKLLTGNEQAYTYLPETSARFPAGKDFLSLMDRAGTFSDRKATSLTGGVAWIYVGTVK